MKFAKATKFHRKSGGGLGDGSPRLWSAGGAALPTFGEPHLRRSDDVAESMSQPSRTGLMFGYRPYGPRSDSRSIFEFPHRLGRAWVSIDEAANLVQALAENKSALRGYRDQSRRDG
jgi:hypothetical protein